jgi:hypothetical protein
LYHKVWSTGSFTPASLTRSEADRDTASGASQGQLAHPHSFRNVFEQFSQSFHGIETDDGDGEEHDILWDHGEEAGGQLSPTLKYQRRSASWRRSNNTDR